MLRTTVTPERIAQWKEIYNEYKGKLKPNRKTGQELIDYLESKYELISFQDERASKVVYMNVMENEHWRKKLPIGENPHPMTFYWKQNDNDVFIGIDLASGFYHIESNEDLWDELCAFQGLDEDDLKNYFCVAQYISCLKKFGRLGTV